MEWPPEVGTGASPSSAIRDRYSLSMRALSCADCGGSLPGGRCAENELRTHKHVNTCTDDINKGCNIANCEKPVWSRPYLVYLQSDEMWPAPPHFVQRVVLVMLRGSVFCHGRRILQTQWRSDALSQVYWNSTPLLRDNPLCTLNSNATNAADAPTCCHLPWESRWAWPALSAASSGGRSDPRESRFLVSECCESEQIFGVNNALSKKQETRARRVSFLRLLTCSTAFFTFSMVLAVTRACRGSSSPGSIWPSFRPTFPSLTEPFPLIMILAQHSFSMFFRVLPLETIRRGKVNTVVWTRRWVQKWSLAVQANPAHRGPISRPTKLISGYSSWGIITLSLTLVAGGLKNRKKWSVQTW